MFVRWKRRQRTRTTMYGQWGTGEWVKSAVLVQSVRTEAGPRHKHVCYLGSIREAHQEAHYVRVGFWESVVKNLDRVEITGADRKRIEATLEAVVPKPSKASEARARAEMREIMTGLRKH
jgi:hypothetical protein